MLYFLCVHKICVKCLSCHSQCMSVFNKMAMIFLIIIVIQHDDINIKKLVIVPKDKNVHGVNYIIIGDIFVYNNVVL